MSESKQEALSIITPFAESAGVTSEEAIAVIEAMSRLSVSSENAANEIKDFIKAMDALEPPK